MLLCSGTQHGHPINGRPPLCRGLRNLVRQPDIHFCLVADPYSPRRGWLPLEVQPFPQAAHLFRKLAPLWEHGIHNWSQILCRGPDGRPYFLEERELQWANPSLQFPLPKALTQALKYFRVLLSSTGPTHWLLLSHKLTWPQGLDYSITPARVPY